MDADFREQLQKALGSAYTTERELGGGGMSRVFLATETTLGRKVVVKVLPPDLTAELSVERFRREIQVAAQLQNPHIVPLLSAGEGNGLLYYTMPYVEGESLRIRLARDGELPLATAVQVMRDVAKALAYAHRHGVVHRDIKPENILFSEGEALVADFGVAKALSASTAGGQAGLTSVGLALGTPAYMAPEQAAADSSVDARADLYALGAVTYEMLTGSALFPGRSPQALIVAHTTETPEAIERRRPNIPAPLAALVMRLLAKRPADRPQSADDVLREIEAMGVVGGTGMTAVPIIPARASWRAPRSRLAAAAVIAVAVTSTLVIRARRADHAAPSSTPVVAEASIAVLPFVNMSSDRENEYFSDGMTEELIDRLANIRGLRVAARTSAFAFKGKQADVTQIGRQLHVRNVVEGSVRRMGSHIRVTAQLISTDSGYHRWSHTYDGDLKDVFAVQQQIGTAIVAELRLALVGRDSALLARTPTLDTAAHTLYLQGRFFWNKRTGGALRRAADLFREASAHDPKYAEAYAGLADTYSVIPAYLDVPADPALDSAEEAAHKALSLDSSLSGPHATLGTIFQGRWQWEAGDAEFRHAIDLRPGDATAHHWRGMGLISMGRPSEGMSELRLAKQLDPLSMVIRQDAALGLIFSREFTSAEAEIRAALALDSSFSGSWLTLGEVFASEGQFDKAISAFRRGLALEGLEPFAGNLALMAVAFARSGQRDSALAVYRALERRARTHYVAPGALGVIALSLGARDSAVQLLGRAIDSHDAFVSNYFPLDPAFDSLRSDPRFAELKRRMNLP